MKLLCGTFMFLLVVLTIQVTCAEQENATTTEAAPAVAGVAVGDSGDPGARSGSSVSKSSSDLKQADGVRKPRADEVMIVSENGKVKKVPCRYVTKASELKEEWKLIPKDCIGGTLRKRIICPELLALYKTICRRRIPVLVAGVPVGTFVTDIN